MSEFKKVAKLAEVPPEGRLSVIFEDRPVLVFRIGEHVYAVEDICSHDGQPLTEGPLHGPAVECPRHGARFDVRTGRPLCMPAVEPIPVYDVQVTDGDVLLRPR